MTESKVSRIVASTISDQNRRLDNLRRGVDALIERLTVARELLNGDALDIGCVRRIDETMARDAATLYALTREYNASADLLAALLTMEEEAR